MSVSKIRQDETIGNKKQRMISEGTKKEQRKESNKKRSQRSKIIAALTISIFGFFAGYFIIPRAAGSFEKAGQFGIDIGKFDITNLAERERRPHVPEGLGSVVGIIFLVTLQVLKIFVEDDKMNCKIDLVFEISTFLLFLGFSDDVLDIRWRYKIYVSAVFTIPLIHYTWDNRSIILPKLLNRMFNKGNIVFDLGIMYSIFVFLLTIFCINSINIYSGINGLEVGQSVVISVFSVIYAGVSLLLSPKLQLPSKSLSLVHSDTNCVFVICSSLPFILTSAALYHYNKYPSLVFVGDSYTHFAGATLAAIGITGRFPFVLLLLFFPQVLNFVLSVPQLLSSNYPPALVRFLRRFLSDRAVEILITCPRHRVPRYDPTMGMMRTSPNLTLINAVLYVVGPMHEAWLGTILIALQVVVNGVVVGLCALGVLPLL